MKGGLIENKLEESKKFDSNDDIPSPVTLLKMLSITSSEISLPCLFKFKAFFPDLSGVICSIGIRRGGFC